MKIAITGPQSKMVVISELSLLPEDGSHEITIKKLGKSRTGQQNKYLWSAIMADFANQAVIDGKRFDADVWHEWLKEKFLPETFVDGITVDGYVKWREKPDGSLMLVGSTTKLTTKGFANYNEQLFAFGAQELGIKFSVDPRIV